MPSFEADVARLDTDLRTSRCYEAGSNSSTSIPSLSWMKANRLPPLFGLSIGSDATETPLARSSAIVASRLST